MKKLLSYIALAAVSLGFCVSAYANGTLIYRHGITSVSYPNYAAPGCGWTSYTVSTPGGVLTTATLNCSGTSIATYNYYNGNSAGAPINSINSNYYVTRRSGEAGANVYDYAVYKKASVGVCSTPWSSGYVYNDLTSVSYARAMTERYNPGSCSTANRCVLDIAASETKYALVCR